MWGLIDDDAVLLGFDRNQMAENYPLSIDVDETVCNVFSSLNISSPDTIRCRRFLPIGVGEGSVHPFRSDTDRRRIYSSVAHANRLTVDPHLHHYPMWRNREVRSSVFDQTFDFDQSSDLLLKEHLYCTPHLITNSISRSVVNDDVNLVSSKTRNQLVSLLSLKELSGVIHDLAKDQNGCRLLQAKFENPTIDEIEFVLFEVLNSITDLMKDQFGNYLIQKLISVCNDDHKLRILLSLTDVPVEMVLVCMNPHGTRAMQKLLENLTDPYQIALAMAALRPGAARLANDPNGHHVIQYCLIHFPSDVIMPILNEIASKCYEVATDRSGCCVLQACMEHSLGKVRNRLVAEILGNAVLLAEDPYGNYVLQHMVGLKVAEFTAGLVRQLQGNFAPLSCNKYASNVVEKCLNESGEEISRQIVMELITCSNPSMLLTDPYANFVIQSALTVSSGYVYDCLLELISDNLSSMRTNLYGKKILAWFEKRRILAI
ncbi:hypothetical protein L1987_80461 [Smallanthus sonchifolius]|uniref:Uncharacterized protein n=1 Tax=Smallanthus sonchifolius TaxID=185202 RepID=A0ACB8YLZ7_9ASTR|nr:hypothetical protein L1987_80461 [Smallanthus sonchifolius]